MAELTITKSNFQKEVLESDLPVLIDFWASWCGPCMMMAPEVEKFAEAHAGSVKVGKVNVDEEPELAGQFGIASIPTILLFKEGKVANTMVGYRPKEELDNILI